jgi:hypothetical protein
MEAIIQVQYGAKEEEKMEQKNLNYAPRGKIEYYYYAFMLYWIIEIWPSFFFWCGGGGWLAAPLRQLFPTRPRVSIRQDSQD